MHMSHLKTWPPSGLHDDLTCSIMSRAVCGRPLYRSFTAMRAEYNLGRGEVAAIQGPLLSRHITKTPSRTTESDLSFCFVSPSISGTTRHELASAHGPQRSSPVNARIGAYPKSTHDDRGEYVRLVEMSELIT